MTILLRPINKTIVFYKIRNNKIASIYSTVYSVLEIKNQINTTMFWHSNNKDY